VNFFDKDTLVLELVTLGEHIEGMVNVLVDLASIAHLFQQPPQNANAAHPQDLEWQTSIGGTTTLTST
jgi:hypothetical protein